MNGVRVRNPKLLVRRDAEIEISPTRRFVSRGGEKLDPILTQWNINPEGLVFIDAGSSTGGFTDCLLKRGAILVYAVDVGYNQLDYTLRNDERVRVYERTNIMSLDDASLDPRPDAAVSDLSFRSILGASSRLLRLVSQGWLIGLVKPQFEWRNPEDDFDGVIRRNDVLLRVLSDLVNQLWENGCYVTRIALSPIRGRKGNREFFCLLKQKPVGSKKTIEREIGSLVFERVT